MDDSFQREWAIGFARDSRSRRKGGSRHEATTADNRRPRVRRGRPAPSPRDPPAAYPARMTQVPTDPARPSTPEPRVTGEAIVYRLYDVGYGIQLDPASELLASSAPERPRPV